VFDLFLFSLNMVDREMQPELPGFFAAAAPRKSARLRSEDMLAALLSTSVPLSQKDLDEIFDHLAQAYFTSSGTVTAGMRSVVEKLNTDLLDRNLRTVREGIQVSGLLNLAVLHHDTLYLLQVGHTHAFTLTHTHVTDHSDVDAGRGIGLNRTLSPRFYQEAIVPGDLLIFSPDPPGSWSTSTLAGSTQSTLDHLRRRLLNQSGPHLQAGVVQFQKGKGLIHRLRLRTSLPPAMATASTASASPQMSGQSPESTQSTAPEIPAHKSTGTPPPTTVPSSIPPVAKEKINQPVKPPPAATMNSKPGQAYAQKEPRKQSPPKPQPQERREILRLKLAHTWLRWKDNRARNSKKINDFFTRLLPGVGFQLPSISPAALLFISIIIPLAVVAIAMTVYFQRGQVAQQKTYLLQVQTLYTQAHDEKDATLKRTTYEQALNILSKAETFGRDDDTRNLRVQIQNDLDVLDGVLRLELMPAAPGELPPALNITRMATNGSDLYLLDGVQGKIHRLYLNGTEYKYDREFSCAPGPSGGLIISPIVNLVSVPPVTINHATILALDTGGNLLYCLPDQEPSSVALLPPGNYWGKISSFTLFQQSLYVLDTQLSAVWVYEGDSNLGFGKTPDMFFGDEVPFVADVNDMLVFADNLYLLHQDGHMTRCSYSGFNYFSTRCVEPFLYHPGQKIEESMERVPGTKFIQMQYTAPFSIYILDANKPALYHYSTNLNLQQLFRPDTNQEITPPDSSPTAFTINPEFTIERRVFIAYGNQVFYATLP
jgi:hypothetical protein